jgi:hypothetical protein
MSLSISRRSSSKAPPVQLDVARQVRVFEPYLQYDELRLTGAAIHRHRLAIPKVIQNLGADESVQSRLKTTFDLIEREGALSSKPIEDELNEIRKNFTPSLGKDHGRVLLKAQKAAVREALERASDKTGKVPGRGSQQTSGKARRPLATKSSSIMCRASSKTHRTLSLANCLRRSRRMTMPADGSASSSIAFSREQNSSSRKWSLSRPTRT